MESRVIALCAAVLVAASGFVALRPADAGEVPPITGYKVLAPIRSGNLTVFPVVAAKSHSTGEFLTLDEGLRSGEVIVTESGMVRGLERRPNTGVRPSVWREHGQDAQVNRLVLVNNSKRPLLLLAGEIVTGGKQDRVIGKDRIVRVICWPAARTRRNPFSSLFSRRCFKWSISPPAEKPRPSPVTTRTRITSSAATLVSTSRISSRIGPPNALSLSGRFSLMVATGPSVLKMMASYMSLCAFGKATLCPALATRRV